MSEIICAFCDADCLKNGCRRAREAGVAQRPMGCICPPTSEKTCRAPLCPRRSPFDRAEDKSHDA